jgi:ADP-ribosylglycohydrolase
LESRSKRNEMSNKGKSMVMASFVADSLALGAHWIYDTEEISSKFGKVDTLLKPVPDSYHSTKEKGEFTHYGDQSLVLLESIAAKRGFDLTDFSDRWRALFEDYKGYIDQATKITLTNYAAGKTAENAGSPSDEIAGASRMAPLVFCNREDPVKLAEDVRAQTSMTHQDPLTLDSAEFFALVTRRVLKGSTPVEAINQVSDERFAQSPLSQWAAEGLESRDKESVPVISNFGQT